ncbi:MAG: metalloprotease [Haloarculaceae archaeon]
MRELRDLAVAWVVLGLAFTIVMRFQAIQGFLRGAPVDVGALAGMFLLTLATVGLGFLLHELGHKVVAIRFGQVAEFRADYNMLVFALLGSLLGVVFAAPGAVHHRGRLTERQRGLIALAGPLVNVALAVGFAVLLVAASTSTVAFLGAFGFFINVFLAAFNMIPFGPLDGRTVLDWSRTAFVAVFVPTAAVTIDLLGLVNLPYVGLPVL